jgi:transcriptional regulator with AAA-type ATPase domain
MTAELAPSLQKALQTKLDGLALIASEIAVLYTQDATQEDLSGLPSIYRGIGLHKLLTTTVYSGALPEVMDQVRGNQSKAAEMFGLNRATTRTRLKEHGMLEPRRELSAAEIAKREAA